MFWWKSPSLPRTAPSGQNWILTIWVLRSEGDRNCSHPSERSTPPRFYPIHLTRGAPPPKKGWVWGGVIIPPQIFVWCQIEAIRHHIPLTPLICVVPYWGYSAPRVVPNSPKLAPHKWGGRGLWCRIAASYLQCLCVYCKTFCLGKFSF